MRRLRHRFGHARGSKLERERAKLARFEKAVEALLIHYGVPSGQAFVWMTNHGSFIRESFERKRTPGSAAERIMEFHREESLTRTTGRRSDR